MVLQITEPAAEKAFATYKHYLQHIAHRLDACYATGEARYGEIVTATQISGETIRATLARLDPRWRRAKQWITNPDPAYLRTKERATA